MLEEQFLEAQFLTLQNHIASLDEPTRSLTMFAVNRIRKRMLQGKKPMAVDLENLYNHRNYLKKKIDTTVEEFLKDNPDKQFLDATEKYIHYLKLKRKWAQR